MHYLNTKDIYINTKDILLVKLTFMKTKIFIGISFSFQGVVSHIIKIWSV